MPSSTAAPITSAMSRGSRLLLDDDVALAAGDVEVDGIGDGLGSAVGSCRAGRGDGDRVGDAACVGAGMTVTTGLGDVVRRRCVGDGEGDTAAGLGLADFVRVALGNGGGGMTDDGELEGFALVGALGLGLGAGLAVARTVAVGDGDGGAAPAGAATSSAGPRRRAATHASSETRKATTHRL